MPSRREFLRLASASVASTAIALAASGCQKQASESIFDDIQAAPSSSVFQMRKRRNILFIVVDDLRPDLGCYGHPTVISPNMDALAETGTLYTRAYCQIALCGPSRASVLSGYRPDSSGVVDNSIRLRSAVPDVVTLPQHFRNNGYATIALGKVYHHRHEDTLGWDVDIRDVIPESSDKPSSDEVKPSNSTEAGDVPDNAYHDGALADLAISTLRKVESQPFFLAVGFKKPHLPFQAPKKYWDLYDRDTIPLPNAEHPDGAPKQAFSNWGELRRFDDIPAKGDLGEAKTQELIHGYRACISYVDAQIGRLLDELDRLGLRDSTTILLWGDHGYKLGEYGDWTKHTNFEYDTHSPMIMCDPDQQQNQICDALVEFIDIYPTLAETAGLDIPEHCDGTSIRPLQEDPTLPWKGATLSQFRRNPRLMGHSLRTERWRYTEWSRIANGNLVTSELYDHINGPRATENVVNHIENAELVDSLQQTLAIYHESGDLVYPPLYG